VVARNCPGVPASQNDSIESRRAIEDAIDAVRIDRRHRPPLSFGFDLDPEAHIERLDAEAHVEIAGQPGILAGAAAGEHVMLAGAEHDLPTPGVVGAITASRREQSFFLQPLVPGHRF
jgi:hypothetical protein